MAGSWWNTNWSNGGWNCGRVSGPSRTVADSVWMHEWNQPQNAERVGRFNVLGNGKAWPIPSLFHSRNICQTRTPKSHNIENSRKATPPPCTREEKKNTRRRTVEGLPCALHFLYSRRAETQIVWDNARSSVFRVVFARCSRPPLDHAQLPTYCAPLSSCFRNSFPARRRYERWPWCYWTRQRALHPAMNRHRLVSNAKIAPADCVFAPVDQTSSFNHVRMLAVHKNGGRTIRAYI